MKFLLVSLFLLQLVTSCTYQDDVTSTGIAGEYELINDPLKCSLPAAKKVQVIPEGFKLYTLKIDLISGPSLTIKQVLVPDENEKIVRFVKGADTLGQRKWDSYWTDSGPGSDNVLYLGGIWENHSIDFMGKK